jgi:FAD/FMN-containing dehydrogenase
LLLKGEIMSEKYGNRKYFPMLLMALGLVLAACQASPPEIAEMSAVIEEAEWDLLWVTDSSGWGVAEKYGKFISDDMGVPVNVMDKWKGELSISENSPMDWNCAHQLEKFYVNTCGMETFELYIEHLKEIYSIIFELREGKSTIIRAIDAYNPHLANKCAEDGVMDECVACWENYNNAIHQAADAMGVPVANVFDAWNGPDHTEDPVDKGYTRSDNIHPNDTGAAVIAKLLRDLGYEATIP